MSTTYPNRFQAGRALARSLAGYAGRPDVLVLGLVRGGVPVASEVAAALRVPLDVFLVRKITLPGQRGLALGAVASGGVRVLNDIFVYEFDIPHSVIEDAAREKEAELQETERIYREHSAALGIREKVVIVIDDGIVTGASMRAAVRAIRYQGAARIIVAAPAISPAAAELLKPESDEVVYLILPDPFHDAGEVYDDFTAVTDDEIIALLKRSREEIRGGTERTSGPV